FLAPHWGRRADDGRVVLRSDPAHRLVNPILYRIEEARACWRNITAPVLAIDATETYVLGVNQLTPEEVAARRACFGNLRVVEIPGAGHMLHHEQPEQIAGLVEAFLD